MKNNQLLEENETIDPYKLLFPLGVFSAVLSVLLWVFFNYRWIDFYPRAAHSNLMFFGFFWSFISGFLMTAIPKMTRTKPASNLDISITVFLVFLQIVFNFFNWQKFSLLLFAVQASGILVFGMSRIFKHGRLPFSGFVFLPVAIVQAVAAISLFTLFNFNTQQSLKVLWSEALVLNLIIGLGSRLVPVITRIKNAISPDQGGVQSNWSLSLAVLFLLNAGYYIEIFVHRELGIVSRLIAVALASVYHFRIFADMATVGNLGKMIRMSIVFIFFGQLLTLLLNIQDLSGVHVLYIAGLALMTVLISFRVVLAHGKADIQYEISGKRILLVGFLFGGAALFRFLMSSNIYGLQIWLAIALFLAGAAAWLTKFASVNFSSPK